MSVDHHDLWYKANSHDIALARARWLNGQPEGDLVSHFNPQPWRQAALVLREMGYDDAARSIAIQRRARERLADDIPRFHAWVSWILHKTADYGFNPWKTVYYLALLSLLCSVIFWWGLASCGGWNGLTNSDCRGGPAYTQVLYGELEGANRETAAYPTFNPLIYSVDRVLPIPDLGMERFWRPNTDAWLKLRNPMLKVSNQELIGNMLPIGRILYAFSALGAFLGTILVAIAVTGFTGILTRDER